MYSRLTILLNEHNLSPYKLSKLINISNSSLSDWKRGRSTPKVDKLQMIADYFGVSLEWLMGKTDIRDVISQPIDKEISDEEWELIKKYRLIDRKAKRRIFNSLEQEYEDWLDENKREPNDEMAM